MGAAETGSTRLCLFLSVELPDSQVAAAHAAALLPIDPAELSSDMGRLFDSGRCSDVSFMVVDTDSSGRSTTSVVPAHRAILSVRSPVFRAMFASPMAESSARHVRIEGMSEKVFRAMLFFVYTGIFKVPLPQPSDPDATATPTTTKVPSAAASAASLDDDDDDDDRVVAQVAVARLDSNGDDDDGNAANTTRGHHKHHHLRPLAEKKTKVSSKASSLATHACVTQRNESGSGVVVDAFYAQVLSAAEQYQLPTLSAHCINAWCASCTVGNVLDRLGLFGSTTAAIFIPLRDACMRFILGNPQVLHDVRRQRGFVKLSSEHLLMILDGTLPPSASSSSSSSSSGASKRRRGDEDTIAQSSSSSLKTAAVTGASTSTSSAAKRNRGTSAL